MKKTFFLILLAMPVANNIRAQSIGPSVANASGGTAVIGGNEFDWSVGEMTMVTTFTTSGIIVTQGLLQPYDGNVNRVVNNSMLATQLQVFPNPASSVVNLQYSSSATGTLSYKLFDLGGKLISKRTINVKPGTTTDQVNVAELAVATYMLEVTVNAADAAPESISYKIQKLK